MKKRFRGRKGVRGLAEAIILQAMEDLWSAAHMKAGIEFFIGKEFDICSNLAAMPLESRIRILTMVKAIAHRQRRLSEEMPARERHASSVNTAHV